MFIRVLLCFFSLIFGGMSYILLIGYYAGNVRIRMTRRDFITLGSSFFLWWIMFCGYLTCSGIIKESFLKSFLIRFSLDTYILFLILTIISWIDHKAQIIPNFLNLLIFIMGIILTVCHPEQPGIWQRIAGMVIISLPLILINLFYPSGFGGGDIKLMAAAGYYLGAELIFRGALLASFMAALICLYLLIFRKAGRNDKVAFGPYLCAGIMLVMMAG